MPEDNLYKEHLPIMVDEIVSCIKEHPQSDGGLYVDLTFGGGGHTFKVLDTFSQMKVIAFDQDPDAIQNGKKNINEKNVTDRIRLVYSNFRDVKEKISSIDFFNEKGGIDFVLMDIGVSTHHFLDSKRGFSFREDGPLDMRMDFENNELTAKIVVNEYEEEELEDIFCKYGEEKFSKRIAREIVNSRNDKEISTTKDLEEIVFRCYPKKLRFQKTHPATRVFQALRIFVNKELEVLEETIPEIFNLLRPGGRLMIITFHSLEDRIVKHTFRKFAKIDGTCKLITKKALIPTVEEIFYNPRSRSAKLRIIEKI